MSSQSVTEFTILNGRVTVTRAANDTRNDVNVTIVANGRRNDVSISVHLPQAHFFEVVVLMFVFVSRNLDGIAFVIVKYVGEIEDVVIYTRW